MTRVDPPTAGDERATLVGYLDYHRETLAEKCAGLSPEQLARRSVSPSELSLLGLVRHLAEVERRWFQNRVAGIDVGPVYLTDDDEDADFHLPGADSDDLAKLASQAMATWRAEVNRSNGILAAVPSLDDRFEHERDGQLSIRWLIVHMIEEYARHNGHADLLREAIDGTTGE
jgi:uncharacterized damage-inducible protein DinB